MLAVRSLSGKDIFDFALQFPLPKPDEASVYVTGKAILDRCGDH